MIKIILLYILFPTILLSKDLISFGKFQNDNTIFVQKDISKLSQKFLGVKYVSNTLSHSEMSSFQENLIINFDAFDCFTFIDTLEALKASSNKNDFISNLIDLRYKEGKISYQNRNHFFSDWIDYNSMIDITCTLGYCNKKIKYLNKNEKYLKNIPTIKRVIFYININDVDITLLQNGDYVGIYTNKDDLDVTHTGIIIKKADKVFLRHASLLKKEIIDSDLLEYTKNKIGIVVYRLDD